MAQKRWLRRLGTGALAAGISLTALGAVQVSGVPDLTAGLLIAGSFFTDPAAAISAADRMFEQSQTAAAPVPQPIAPTPQPSAAPEPTFLPLLRRRKVDKVPRHNRRLCRRPKLRRKTQAKSWSGIIRRAKEICISAVGQVPSKTTHPFPGRKFGTQWTQGCL